MSTNDPDPPAGGRYSARKIVSADKDYEVAEADTIEDLRAALEVERESWHGTCRVYDQQPPEGSLDQLVAEIDLGENGVSPLRGPGNV